MKILLVKEGQTDFEAENRLTGGQNPLLNETGKKWADEALEKLGDAEVAAVFCAEHARCADVAKKIAEKKGKEAVTDERLNENCLGRWESLTEDEVKKGYPIVYKHWSANPAVVIPPGGERIEYVMERVRMFYYEKMARLSGNVVIVAPKITRLVLKVFLQELKRGEESKKGLKKLWKTAEETPDIDEIEIR